MRRTISKVIDKSSEKKKHEAIVQAIATEESVLAAYSKEIKVIEDKITTLKSDELDLSSSVALLLLQKESTQDEYETILTKIRPLQSEVDSLVKRISDLTDNEEYIRKIIEQHQIQLTDIVKNNSEATTQLEDEYRAKKKVLSDEVTELESKLALLTKNIDTVTKEIEDKKREQLSVDATLRLRVEELTKLNSNLNSTKSASVRAANELKEIDQKIRALQSEIAAKDKEIEDKNSEILAREKDVEKRRLELVALMGREKKIDEKAQAVKDLFQLAGVNVEV